MATNRKEIDFVPMSSIGKTPDGWDKICTDWVATEKVHGSSFQLYTDDGITVHTGSRRRNLDLEDSFLKCRIPRLVENYWSCVIKLWNSIKLNDRWNRYRDIHKIIKVDDSDNSDNSDGISSNSEHTAVEEALCDDECCEKLSINIAADDHFIKDKNSEFSENTTHFDQTQTENLANDTKTSNKINNKTLGCAGNDESLQLRIYGELYGGGGLDTDTKRAIQKEILYCDDFRFYVFGITINRRWLTISELNQLCEEAGFPYYAKPVNGEEPKKTVEELKAWLEDTGMLRRKSALTERTDDYKTFLEGFVMTPLTKTDYRLHAIKYLAPAFNDVRFEQRTSHTKKAKMVKTQTANYCTKQRYHSVISKLEDHERRDTALVVGMMIADIIEESEDSNPTKKQRKFWSRLTIRWLREDGYCLSVEEERQKRNGERGGDINKEGYEEQEEADEGGCEEVREEETEEDEGITEEKH